MKVLMFLVDDLLGLPFAGFSFVLRTLQKVAEEQYTDDAPVKERLLELQLKLESGEISEEEYAHEETAIIRELRAIENRKRELAGAPAAELDRGIAFSAGELKASASVTFYQDSHRKS
jgi:Gas vesicle protein G